LGDGGGCRLDDRPEMATGSVGSLGWLRDACAL